MARRRLSIPSRPNVKTSRLMGSMGVQKRKNVIPSTKRVSREAFGQVLKSLPGASTGLAYDKRMTLHRHEWFSGEQESPSRISGPFSRIQSAGLLSRCVRVPARHASKADLLRIHSEEYVELVKRSARFTKQQLYDLSGQFDGVFFNAFTWTACSLAAGTVQQMAALVASGQLSNGLALVRPPGHHAMRDEACGYCIFNNVAVAAASLLDSLPKSAKVSTANATPSSAACSRPVQSALATVTSASSNRGQHLKRILIVDWDVHQGQGTQYAFYRDKRVLFISIHRYENTKFWPNLREGDFDFIGEGEGRGYNINIPLNTTGLTDSDYVAIFQNLIMPVATEFNPELVFVSCGFDAALGCAEVEDQIQALCKETSMVNIPSKVSFPRWRTKFRRLLKKGQMWLNPACYGYMVQQLRSLAGGRLVVVLEGGYFLDSLEEGCVHVLKALLGDELPPMRTYGVTSSSVTKTLASCTTALRAYWSNLNVPGISRSLRRPDISHLPQISWPTVKRVVWPEKNPTMPKPLIAYARRLLRRHLPAPPSPPTAGALVLLLPLGAHLATGDSSQGPRNPWTKRALADRERPIHSHYFMDPSSVRPLSSAKQGPSSLWQDISAWKPTARRSSLNMDSQKKLHPPENSLCTHALCEFGRGRHLLPDLRLALKRLCVCLLKNQFSSAVIAAKHLSLEHLTSAITAVPAGLLRTFRKPVDPSIYVFPSHLLGGERNSATTGSQVGNSRKRGLEGGDTLRSPTIPAKRARVGSGPASLLKKDQPHRSLDEHFRLMFLDFSGECCLREAGSSSRKVSQTKGRTVEENAIELLAFSLTCSDSRGRPHQFTSAALIQHFEPPSTERVCSLRGRHISLDLNLHCVHRGCAASSSSRGCLHTCANILSLVNSLILPMGSEFGPDLIVVSVGNTNFGLPGSCPRQGLLPHLVFPLRTLGSHLILAVDPKMKHLENLLHSVFQAAPPNPFSRSLSTKTSEEFRAELGRFIRENKRNWNCFPLPDSLPLWRTAEAEAAAAETNGRSATKSTSSGLSHHHN